jgi:hypothetical protein
MSEKHGRREFLGHGVKACAVFCAMGGWRAVASAQEGAAAKTGQAPKPLDLKVLSYCGIPRTYCEQQCELFKATRENDAKLKKAVYEQWEMKKKFGVDWDPDKIFCYGCKPDGKPLKVGMAECPVRVCPSSHSLESCVQCLDLASCDKAFWKEWPNAYDLAKKLQARYAGQPGATLGHAKK